MNSRDVKLTVQTISLQSSGQEVKTLRIVDGKADITYLLRIVNKRLLESATCNFNSHIPNSLHNELLFLLGEVSTRTQFFHSGLCQLVAVRECDDFTFLCKRLCENWFDS